MTEEPVENTSSPLDDLSDLVEDDTSNISLEELRARLTRNIYLSASSLEKLDALIKEKMDKIGQATYSRELIEPNSHASVQAGQFHSAYNFKEPERLHEIIKNIEDKEHFRPSLVDKTTGKTVLGVKSPKVKKLNDKELSGTDALIAYKQAKSPSSIRRFPLYNSGFHIDLVAPSLSIINNMLTQARLETQFMGRKFGSYYYLYSDYHLKDVAIKMFLSLIKGSTLRGWNTKEILVENIKLPDLMPILLYTASLMFPDGHDGFKHACTNPECSHVEDNKIDILELIRHDYSKMNRAAIGILSKMHATDSVGQSELLEYHKALNMDKIERMGNVAIHLAVPSIARYMVSGGIFMRDLTSAFNLDDNDDVIHWTVYNFYRQLAPWIKAIYIYEDEESDNKVATITNVNAISDILDEMQTEDGKDQKTFEVVKDYINSIQMSVIGFPAYPCPACGTVPETESGYITVDPMQTFFTMCIRKYEGEIVSDTQT